MYIRTSEEEIDRDRGILTPSDRSYLTGLADLEPESERQTRQRIRNRIKDSIRDFWFIRYSLSDKDRELIGDELFGDAGPLWQGYVDMLAFFYDLNLDRGMNMKTDLVNAIKSVEKERYEDRDVKVDLNVTFDVERELVYDYDDLMEQFEEGEPLTPDEGWTLFTQSSHFEHLSPEQRYDKFTSFLDGELNNEVKIEREDSDEFTQV